MSVDRFKQAAKAMQQQFTDRIPKRPLLCAGVSTFWRDSSAFGCTGIGGRLKSAPPFSMPVYKTWRLWGSLPAKAEAVPHATPGHAFAAADRELDRRNSGPLWLKDTRIAELVSRTILALGW
jgi:hypothetical protein